MWGHFHHMDYVHSNEMVDENLTPFDLVTGFVIYFLSKLSWSLLLYLVCHEKYSHVIWNLSEAMWQYPICHENSHNSSGYKKSACVAELLYPVTLCGDILWCDSLLTINIIHWSINWFLFIISITD